MWLRIKSFTALIFFSPQNIEDQMVKDFQIKLDIKNIPTPLVSPATDSGD